MKNIILLTGMGLFLSLTNLKSQDTCVMMQRGFIKNMEQLLNTNGDVEESIKYYSSNSSDQNYLSEDIKISYQKCILDTSDTLFLI